MSDYKLYPYRLLDLGLNLRDAPDKVSEGNYVRMRNVRSAQEAQMQAREGLLEELAPSANEVHTIRRIGDSVLLVGAGTRIYRNATLFSSTGWSGEPIAVIPYRPTISSTVWTYLADANLMRKVREDGTDYKWGITGPSTTATFGDGGAGNLNSSVAGGTVYDWRYTYYSTITGAESNPSPTGTGISLTNRRANVTVNASTDAQVDQIRVYRRGGTLSTWRLSVTGPNVSGDIVDNYADSTIAANEAVSTTRDVPFTSTDSVGNVVYEEPLQFAWGPFLGKYILACGSLGRPGHVFWTNAQRADEAASTNNVEVTSPREPLQNGLIYASLPWVFSKDDLYVIDFGSSTSVTFTPRKTPCGRGLAAPWALCAGDRIYFLGPDGIYATDGGKATRISEQIRPIFFGESVGAFTPVDYSQQTRLRMEFHDSAVWFFYQDTDGARQFLVYDTIYDRWIHGNSALTAFAVGYSDENVSTSALHIGGANGRVYSFTNSATSDSGTAISTNIRTGSVDMGMPHTLKEYGNLILDVDPKGNTITVTPYINAEQTALAAQTVTGTGRQKFSLSLSDTFSYSIAIDLAWSGSTSPIIYQMDLLWRPDEEVVQHWEFPETTHGLVGWQHLRDGYLTVRSGATLTFTITVDGTALTPVFINSSNTSGAKRKVYFQMPPHKGKVFKYEINSSAGFRLYGDECEVRAKPWITSLGYSLVTPFAQAG